MKFGTRLYGTHPDDIVRKAVLAESLGFDSVWRGDHFLLPEEITTDYPNLPGGKPPFEPNSPVLDVLMVLSHVAHATKNVKLATGIYVLPLRDPIQVARSVQTLDVLSQGRVIFGCGIGWMREEFDLAGRDFHKRGRITDESIEVLRTLWTEERPQFTGEHFAVSNCRFEPKPPQGGALPIVIGGESEAGLRRAARLGDGWYGHRPSPEEATDRVARLLQLRREFGKEGDPFTITVRAYPDLTIDDVRRFEDAGVDRIVLEVGDFGDAGENNDAVVMERFADRLFQALSSPTPADPR